MKKIIAFCIVLLLTAPFSVAAAPGDAPELSADVPVIMYHGILNGRTGRYFVSEKQLESDLKALCDEGYTAVTPDMLIDFAEGRKLLPEKPVLITFDDGHYNNLYYGMPLLEKYGMCAVINIVGAYSEYSTASGDHSNPNYSHITWWQIEETAQSGVIYYGNHSYGMHKFKPRYGIAQLAGESDSEYEKNLTEDTMRLQEKLRVLCGYEPAVYAYPFGKYSKTAVKTLVSLGIKITLTCNEGVTTVRFGVPESLINMKRINREGNYSTERLMALIKRKSFR